MSNATYDINIHNLQEDGWEVSLRNGEFTDRKGRIASAGGPTRGAAIQEFCYRYKLDPADLSAVQDDANWQFQQSHGMGIGSCDGA